MGNVAVSKVLVANRGEIAVRVIRAARDAGIASVAVYADSDSESLFVKLADEAFALNGATPADTYLNIPKLLDVAARSGANAVHPGYGFLAENAHFAQAVIDAGLIWIGPPPAAIEALGDKVQARHIAQRVGAPLVPGTADPVANADEVVAFAAEHGLPIAIKAAFGGGGRGLKVARTLEEVPEMFESATREAVTAFGRGECFVERYLDKPRHVETQCLADSHGNVVVVSTRDCSLQRRHQKLVEEAPAPFLTEHQVARLYESSKAILKEAGYVGAGTCEFLVALDGTISLPRGQHPPPGGAPGLRGGHPDRPRAGDVPHRRRRGARLRRTRRCTATPSSSASTPRTPAATSCPPPAPWSSGTPRPGPVSGSTRATTSGMTVPGAFDSLVAKLIVTGADRDQAIARSRRALAELQIEGMPTVVPFHQAVLNDPAYTAAGRPLRGAHALDRDRVHRRDRSLHRGAGRGRRCARAGDRHRRGQRQAGRGEAARRLRCPTRGSLEGRAEAHQA